MKEKFQLASAVMSIGLAVAGCATAPDSSPPVMEPTTLPNAGSPTVSDLTIEFQAVPPAYRSHIDTMLRNAASVRTVTVVAAQDEALVYRIGFLGSAAALKEMLTERLPLGERVPFEIKPATDRWLITFMQGFE